MVSGKRVWTCELSTIDSALLLAGMLTAAEYFAGKGADEREIRELTDALYRRADWNWAQDGGVTVTHGCVDAENGKWIGRHGLSVRRPCVRACW
jgi:hypothetical protein